MKNSTLKIERAFDKAKRLIVDAFNQFVIENNGELKLPSKKLFESDSICVNAYFVPESIGIYGDDEQVFVNYRNTLEIIEFGFDDAEQYSDAINSFSMDEMYYIMQCIQFSNGFTKVTYQCE